MRLVVGLGNPGERYRRTRHNVGFMVVDALAHRAGASRGGERAEAWVIPARVGGEDVLLLALENGTPQDLVVVLDDVALDLGTLRVRERGSHGSHNGLRSVIEAVGTDEFPRVRVGVRKGEPPGELAGYVLSEFPQEDVLVVQEVVGWAADAVETLIREGAAAAMNRFNPMRNV